ncbi:MAG: hypothetical protein ACOYX1_13165 [Acidobacteriota bacterium]
MRVFGFGRPGRRRTARICPSEAISFPPMEEFKAALRRLIAEERAQQPGQGLPVVQ